jgi:CheY-like chemotaxis protein
VVDDNEHNREYARQVLVSRWAVDVAPDGEAALELVARGSPDLLVLDLSMPRVDGWQVLKRLRSNPATQQIPTVACSAHAMPGDRERALAAGFDGYVTKPYRPEELRACVEGFLGPGEPAGDDDGWGGDDWNLTEDEWLEESA